VIVVMTEASGERRDRVVQELHRISREIEQTDSFQNYSDGDGDENSDDDDSCGKQPRKSRPKLLTINASDAIPNWPPERVPAMFAYRDGTKQHEWIAGRRGLFPSRDILEQLFREWNVI